MAEEALLYAIAVNKNSYIAANKLERWYRLKGQDSKAKKYARLARIYRNQNPYFQFSLAKKSFEAEKYKTARRYIRRAQNLYDEDSRFFQFHSRIELALGNHLKALNQLQTAYELAKTEEQLDQYLAEAVAIAEEMKKLGLAKSKDVIAASADTGSTSLKEKRKNSNQASAIEEINKNISVIGVVRDC